LAPDEVQPTDNPDVAATGIPIEPPRAVGPDYEDTGDPSWIEPQQAVGGMLSGDLFSPYGRWRERIYEPREADPPTSFGIGLMGLVAALERLFAAVVIDAADPATQDSEPVNAGRQRRITAIAAAYDALEWTHSLDELCRRAGKYQRAPDLDPVGGPIVLGAIGARNASHHGLRQVVDIVDVARPLYEATGNRLVRSPRLSESMVTKQVRWVENLPLPPLNVPSQESAYLEHLAGREVRNTFILIRNFFFASVLERDDQRAPLFTAASAPPHIDPRSVVDEQGHAI